MGASESYDGVVGYGAAGASTTESERDGIDEATRRLIRALSRNGPTPDWSIQRHRETFEVAARTRPLAPGVRTSPLVLADLSAEWAVPERAGSSVVLYLHGGGFVMGTVATTRPLATHLAAAVGAPVLYPEYRLAPEHPYPAALEDALASYRWLLDQGIPSERIALAGDSAGGGLALLALLKMRDESLPLPCACVCLSPFIDLALSSPSLENARLDPQAPRWLLEHMVRAYLGGADPQDPAVCASYADLHGLPPVLIQVGGLESVRDDGIRFAQRARDAGVQASLQVWPDAIHVWHAFAPRLPAARDALAEVGGWLTPYLKAGGSGADGTPQMY
ncbi:alpha/beta hydrolase [Rhodococcus sp. WS4]|nr:alpha/beta hydrolase [Rhodococcus sp. WS4]